MYILYRGFRLQGGGGGGGGGGGRGGIAIYKNSENLYIALGKILKGGGGVKIINHCCLLMFKPTGFIAFISYIHA